VVASVGHRARTRAPWCWREDQAAGRRRPGGKNDMVHRRTAKGERARASGVARAPDGSAGKSWATGTTRAKGQSGVASPQELRNHQGGW